MAADQFPPRHRNYNTNAENLPKPIVNHQENNNNDHHQHHHKIALNVPEHIIDRKQNKQYLKGLLLGEGGFAQCYQVSDNLEQTFAAKVIPKLSLKTPKQKHKLFAEIKIHQMLTHPNIVKFHHVFEDDHNVYMILELCHNKTFVELLKKRKRMSEPEVRYFMLQLLSGVQYLHRQRVIHRDLKLGNLFISSDMQLKIGDFGLAAILKHDGERKKTICGTPNYIAPEVLFDTSNGHSFEVDIWSLGVVMYTMLIGKPPFQTTDVKAIYKKIRENNYDFPICADVSEAGKSLIASLLTSRPESRPCIGDVLLDPFFRDPIPPCMPMSALLETPDFTSLMRKSQHNNTTTLTASSLLSGFSGMSLSPNSKPTRPAARTVLAEIGLQAATQTRTTTLTSNVNGLVESALSNHLSNGSSSSLRNGQIPGAYVSTSHETKLDSLRSKSSSTCEVPLRKIPQVIDSIASPTQSSQWTNAGSTPKSSAPAQITQNIASVVTSSLPSSSATSPSMLNIKESTLETRLKVYHSRQRSSNAAVLSKSLHSSPTIRKCNDMKPSSPSNAFRKSIIGVPPANANRYVNVLESMQDNLCRALDDIQSGAISRYMPIDYVIQTPKVFISKWIDYSNKYGLGYQLTNGCVGVSFNDSTSIILAPDTHHFDYLYCEKDTRTNSINRQLYTISSHPQELNKKVTLLLHFKNYMQENLFQAASMQYPDTTAIQNLDFLTKYMRTKHGVVFRLSNRVVQINFFDHSKVVLSNEAHTVTFIDKTRSMSTFALSSLVTSKDAFQMTEIRQRLIYAKEIIQQMVLKKKMRND